MSDSGRQNIPVPDPTVLTTEQLRRELGALRDLMEARITSLEKVRDEKFFAVQKQFEQREQRYQASEEANKRAIDAALASQKEMAAAQNAANAAAVLKSEAGVVKQLDSIMALMTTNTTSINDKIAVINGRLDRAEGKSVGSSAIIAGGIAVVAVLISLFAATGVLQRSGANGREGSVALSVPTVPMPRQ